MRYIIILFFAFIISNQILSQENKEVFMNNMYKDVNYLASDKLKGRKTGTKGEKKAAKYIKRKFKEYGLEAKGSCDYYQKFQGKINYHQTSEIQKGFNVIGFCDNNQDNTIIIGAHYDHIGLGEAGSLHVGENEIHNGADDNASGVSILLNLANKLCDNQLYNYLFIAFSGEEEGLLGSSYFAKNPTIDLSKVKFMLNFDMVGRLNEKKELAINGTGTCQKWEDLLKKSNDFNLKLITSESGVGPSDHTSFYWQNIPSIHFFTGQHSDYHKPSDDIEKINFEGMYLILSFVTKIIEQSYYISDFDFQETTNNNTQTPKFNVTLGIMPDYLYDGIGLRIDGVTKEKTAFKFGVKKGDVILEVGDIEIKDIMDYMKALGLFKKGDKTNLKVKRGEMIIELAITFL
ncbi:MAG: peptidase M28 [Flavobacteriales bacterium]|nr:peptidase M28 [Flavobacteriales bacterium]